MTICQLISKIEQIEGDNRVTDKDKVIVDEIKKLEPIEKKKEKEKVEYLTFRNQKEEDQSGFYSSRGNYESNKIKSFFYFFIIVMII